MRLLQFGSQPFEQLVGAADTVQNGFGCVPAIWVEQRHLAEPQVALRLVGFTLVDQRTNLRIASAKPCRDLSTDEPFEQPGCRSQRVGFDRRRRRLVLDGWRGRFGLTGTTSSSGVITSLSARIAGQSKSISGWLSSMV